MITNHHIIDDRNEPEPQGTLQTPIDTNINVKIEEDSEENTELHPQNEDIDSIENHPDDETEGSESVRIEYYNGV